MKFGTSKVYQSLKNVDKKKTTCRRAPLRRTSSVPKIASDSKADDIVKVIQDINVDTIEKLKEGETVSTEEMSPTGLGLEKNAESKTLSVPILETVESSVTELTPKEIEQEVINILTAIGLENHYLSVTGGSKEISDARQSVKHVSVALRWTFAKKFSVDISNPSTQLLSWLVMLICADFKLIVDFCEYMRHKKEYSSSTVYNYLCSISSAVKYFGYYCSKSFGDNVLSLDNAEIIGITDLLSRLQAAYKKDRKKHKGVKSLQAEIYDRHQPVGGIAELKKLATERGQIFLQQNGFTDRFDVTKDVYKECLSLIFVHWYVFAPQGRLSGIADMRLGQFQDLVEIGHAVSDKFKTRTFYFYQPVINVPEAFPFLHKYMEFRLHVVGLSSVQPSDFLFLDWKGNPIGDKVGTYFTSFWTQYNLHLTTTDMRSLMETEIAEKSESGHITLAHQNAAAKVSGHSGQVVKEFYVMKDVAMNVGLARQASIISAAEPAAPSIDASIMTGHSPSFPLQKFIQTDAAECGVRTASDNEVGPLQLPVSPLTPWSLMASPGIHLSSSPSALPIYRPTRDIRVVANWGTEHPDYQAVNDKSGKPIQRATWTTAECDWIRRWCSKKQEANPDVSNIVAKCLQAIKKDPDAIKIFHEIHTLDVGRLRTGYLKAFGLKP
jgi:hypothetical protein